MCGPQLSVIVIGGSSGSGLGPRSYFQTIRPVLGSSAITKPVRCCRDRTALAATTCSSVPPATMSLPSARIGEAKNMLIGCDPGKSLPRALIRHRSAPVARSSA